MTNSNTSKFIDTSKAQDAGHTIGITSQGTAYSYCHNSKVCDNELGQLGRSGNPKTKLPIILGANTISEDKADACDGASNIRVAHAYTGGFASSGHSALLDEHGHLWLSGCDRWQQLGLGSSNAGSSGYTWKNGRLWQVEFQKNEHVVELLKQIDPNLNTSQSTSLSKRWIRDVALGGDHTVILSSNKKDVIVFGKGGEGQLGLGSKPWVSASARSKALSSSSPDIAAVCAFRNCSLTLNESGDVQKTTGKCSMDIKGMRKALEYCQKRGIDSGLITKKSK